MKIRVILTGATGMVGEGVLHECLQHPDVDKVLVVGRRSCGVTHAKLNEVLTPDFFGLSSVESKLAGYNACFFCLGVSSVGMKEAEYFKLTHTLTMQFASMLAQGNPDMVFCYVSGAGTDSTETGRIMWARIKGKTENDLGKLPFRKVYNFRPGIMTPTKGLKNTLTLYKVFTWLMPVVKLIAPRAVVSLRDVGIAMIRVATSGYEKQIIEMKDIIILAGDGSS